MPWNGSGVFARVYSWVADAAAGLDILADRMDTDTDDIAQGLMHCLTVNGETVPTANLPMANYRHTGVSAGVADSDYCTVGQIKNGGGGLSPGGYLPLAGGTLTGELSIKGGVPSLGLINTGPAPAQFGVWCASSVLGFGTVDAAGHPIADLMALGPAGTLSLYAGGLAFAGGFTSLASGGAFTISGSPTITGTLVVDGNITANTVTGRAGLGSNGGLSVAGAGTIGGNLVCNQNITGQLVTGQTGLGTSGGLSVGGNASVGGQVVCALNIYPATNNYSECGIAANAWFGVESYAFVNHSDARSKTDLAPLDADCLGLVRAIAPQRFKWAARPDDGQHWGFVAQQVGAAMQAAGVEFGGHLVDPESGTERLAYHELLAVLWRAVQQLAGRLETLETGAGA